MHFTQQKDTLPTVSRKMVMPTFLSQKKEPRRLANRMSDHKNSPSTVCSIRRQLRKNCTSTQRSTPSMPRRKDSIAHSSLTDKLVPGKHSLFWVKLLTIIIIIIPQLHQLLLHLRLHRFLLLPQQQAIIIIITIMAVLFQILAVVFKFILILVYSFECCTIYFILLTLRNNFT